MLFARLRQRPPNTGKSRLPTQNSEEPEKKLTIRTEHDSIHPVKVDANQLQRVFENLLIEVSRFLAMIFWL
jgi:signal transduction histidine kinase